MNELDAEINNFNRSLAKVLHLLALDGRCSKGGSVLGTSVRTGARLLIGYNGDRSLPVSLDMWDGWKAVAIGVDFKT